MTDSPQVQFDSLREAYAAVYRRPEAQFDRRVFWRCLQPHAWLVAHWMWWFEREFFRTDLEAIRAIGAARCEADLQRAIDDLENAGVVERSIRRGRLMIRLSPARLIALLRPLLPLLKPIALAPLEEFVVPSAPDGPRPRAHAPSRPPSTALRGERTKGGVHLIRTLKRLHSDVVTGRPLETALAEAGLRREEAESALDQFREGRPELEWLRGYLELLAEVERARAGKDESSGPSTD